MRVFNLNEDSTESVLLREFKSSSVNVRWV